MIEEINTYPLNSVFNSMRNAVNELIRAHNAAELAATVPPVGATNIRLLAQDRAQIAGVVACGWCSAKNSHKVMDADLAEAIVDELLRQLQQT